jgi:hypothetical protein
MRGSITAPQRGQSTNLVGTTPFLVGNTISSAETLQPQ